MARNFLIYLGEDHPAVRFAKSAAPRSYILGAGLPICVHTLPPLAQAVYVCRLLFLRSILEEFLPGLHNFPIWLVRSVARTFRASAQRKLCPLTAEQDRLLGQELIRRNDLPANVFLLLRHTGMRIGECADLAYDCLHNVALGPLGDSMWPLGKLKTERMIPVGLRLYVSRPTLTLLPLLSTPSPLTAGLLARHKGKQTLIKQPRPYLSDAATAVGISKRRSFRIN